MTLKESQAAFPHHKKMEIQFGSAQNSKDQL